ncbi:hypothetical protein ACUXZZ_45280 (plasmid) [Streptomyces graminifolii]|uniref:hypothetical protein n=1 Tax=Streptomyces graminifolii TaxID=1266771 RepID=UPI0040583ECB
MITNILAATVLIALGYTIGRTHPGQRLTDWAYRTTDLGRHSWKFWIIVPILLTALMWQAFTEPVRTLANLEARQRTPENR